MNPAPLSDDLLTAFRYFAGEMTPAEQAAFECRLESDTAAQQALSDAVRLTAAIQHVGALQPVPARRSADSSANRGRRALALLVSAGALAAAVLLMLYTSDPNAPRNDRATAMGGSAVPLWSQLDAGEGEVPFTDPASYEEDSASFEEDVVPDWMLTAVRLPVMNATEPDADSGGENGGFDPKLEEDT